VNLADVIDTPLTADQIQARMAALVAPAGEVSAADQDDYRFFRPLEDAAGEWVRWARSPEKRIYTGIPELDAAMRGTAPGELTIVAGFAHSGKTVVTTQVILNNTNRHIAMFTPDETRVLVLIKLTSIVHGVSAEELEQRVANGDGAAEELVRATARDHFPKLAVFDQGLTLNMMDSALDEAEEHWRSSADLVIYDYVDLLEGGAEDTKGKIDQLKGWGKRRHVPLYAMHQSSRSKGANGARVTIDSGAFGGEQQATHMIGVRRKKQQLTGQIAEIEEKIRNSADPKPSWDDQLIRLQAELRHHQRSITINLVKNKRPPSRLVDDIDFDLDPNTGRISPYVMPRVGTPSPTYVEEAAF